MNRANMVIARDRISRLVGQIEGMSWAKSQVEAVWLLERLKPIHSDLSDLTFPTLAAEPQRDPRGRFKSR